MFVLSHGEMCDQRSLISFPWHSPRYLQTQSGQTVMPPWIFGNVSCPSWTTGSEVALSSLFHHCSQADGAGHNVLHVALPRIRTCGFERTAYSQRQRTKATAEQGYLL